MAGVRAQILEDDICFEVNSSEGGRETMSTASRGDGFQGGSKSALGEGRYYYGARYYCPEIGRFIQPDTILDGLNRYAYCWNNPMNYTDPTGNNHMDYTDPSKAPVEVVDTPASGGNDNSGTGGGGSGPSVNGVPLHYTNTDEAGNKGYVDQSGNRYMVRNDDGLLYALNSDTSYSNAKNSRWDLVTIDQTVIATTQTTPTEVATTSTRPGTSVTPSPSSPSTTPNSGNGQIVYAPHGSKEDGTTYTYKVGGPEHHWCNVFLNNDEIADDGNPRSDLLTGMSLLGFLNTITGPPYNASRTKTPFPNTKGYLFYIFNNPSLVQPQHIERYKYDGSKLQVWRTSGEYNDPPSNKAPKEYNNIDNLLQQFQGDFDSLINDFWSVPSYPLN
jgi:RHS repeat-associated protein